MSENPNRTQVLHQTILYRNQLYKEELLDINKMATSKNTEVCPVDVKKLAPLSYNPRPDEADQISVSKNLSL
jgi:hypothetical protein